MADKITESFSIVITIYRFLGLYPTRNQSKLRKIWVYGLYFSQVTTTILLFVNFVVEGHSDPATTNQMGIFFSEAVASCLKSVPFLRNGHRIKSCINYFGDPEFETKSNEEKKIVDECVGICRRNVKIYFVAVLVTVICWSSVPLFQKVRRLPIDVWLPYDLQNPVLYFLSYTFLLAVGMYLGFVGQMMGPLIGGLAYHATCQLKILKHNLRNLIQYSEHYSNAEFESVFGRVKRSIIQHNKILKFISDFENCFSFCVFCELAASMFGLCFSCVGLTMVSLASMYGVMYIISYVVLAFQILFYCHYGTLLFEEVARESEFAH
ncbi:odorant receptor Or1-like [Zophobas morio]|uniref:odorant receptor Or1-like n=1 Tax=Zophobas morio TaxID=2755281 RepID=UPI003082B842